VSWNDYTQQPNIGKPKAFLEMRHAGVASSGSREANRIAVPPEGRVGATSDGGACAPLCSVLSFWFSSPLLLEVFNSLPFLYFGLSVASVGLILFVWAKATLSTEYSPCFDSFIATRVITSGPYSRIRHPIYSANLLMLCGIFLASGSLWIALNVVLVAVYYSIAAGREEAALAQALPDYLVYAQRTGRFVPKINPP